MTYNLYVPENYDPDNGCQILTDGGFVMTTTNMSHSGLDGSWGTDDQKRADFAYRAQHVTALAVKKLIKVMAARKTSATSTAALMADERR